MIFHSSTIHFVYCYILVGETTCTPPYLVALNPMTVIFVSQHSNLNSFIKDISLFAAVLDFNSTSCVFSVPKPSSWRGDRNRHRVGLKSYTVAYHERFYLTHVLPIFSADIIILSRTTHLLQYVNNFTHGEKVPIR